MRNEEISPAQRQIWNYCPLNDNNFQNDYCSTVINILAAPLPGCSVFAPYRLCHLADGCVLVPL